MTCSVYGQLPADWNYDPYGYHPYFALAPNSAHSNNNKNNMARQQIASFRTSQKTDGNNEAPQVRNIFTRGLVTRMELLEITVENLTKELRISVSLFSGKFLNN